MYKLQYLEQKTIDMFKAIPNLNTIIDYYVSIYQPVKPHGNVIACAFHLMHETKEGRMFYDEHIRNNDNYTNDKVLTTLLINAVYKAGYPENKNKINHKESNLLI